MSSKKNIFIFFILIIGAIFRFSYLNWGSPYFFHPDENNIVFAILRLSPKSLNPQFFAYGGLPIYCTYFISFIISMGKPTFPVVDYILRSISATFSFLLIPSLWYIGKRLFSEKVGIIAATLSSVSVGLIQFAHFGTFEMWLTFFGLWFFYTTYLLWEKPTKKHIFLTGILAGILMSVKVSSIVLLVLPFCIFLIRMHCHKLKLIYASIFFSTVVVLLYFVTNPYLFLDTPSFINSLHYESSVALGTTQVFYTQIFLHTTPIIFQLLHVYPFLVNPFIELVYIVSFSFILWKGITKKQFSYVLLLTVFFLLFLSQAILFVKWTRYIVPTLPFIYLAIAIFLSYTTKKIALLSTGLLFIISSIFALAFFLTVYSQDSRIVASQYAGQKFITTSTIVEPYDLGATAFTLSFPLAKIVNIYDLDTDPFATNQLNQQLSTTKIFLSPSQRLFDSRLQDPSDFPQGYTFYTGLLSGKLGFHLMYQTPCNLFCTIVYMGNPSNIEQTASVFDHPIVRIFKKI